MNTLRKIYWFFFVYDLNDTSDGKPLYKEEPLKNKLMRDITYMVLLSYILLIFSSLMPIFADVIAHTFWEKEHMLTVHRVNGKYHVHLEIANNTKQSEKDKSSRNIKSESEEYFHLVILRYNFSNNYFVQRSYRSHSFYCPVSYPDADDRPPKA